MAVRSCRGPEDRAEAFVRDRAHEEALRFVSQIDAMIAEGTIYARFLAMESAIDRLEDEASDAIQYYNNGE